MTQRNSNEALYWLQPTKLALIKAWSMDNYTQEQIAEKMGINANTLSRWKKKYDDIFEALNVGYDEQNYQVVNALLKAALGYTEKQVTTFVGRALKDGSRPVRTETVEKQVGPNVTACMAWLNNRDPDNWKRNRDNIVDPNAKQEPVTINIIHNKDAAGVDTYQEFNRQNKDDEEDDGSWDGWEGDD